MLLKVSAYAAYEGDTLGRMALGRIKQHELVPVLLEQSTRPSTGIAVFVTSEGRFPSRYLRKLPVDPIRRARDVAERGFTLPAGLEYVEHVFVLRARMDGSLPSGRKLKRFNEAIDQACGMVIRVRPHRQRIYEQQKAVREQIRLGPVAPEEADGYVRSHNVR